MTSYINKLVGDAGKQYVYQQDWSTATTNLSDEFGVRWAEDSGNHQTGAYKYWKYVSHSVETGSQGELILSITLENVVGKPLTVTRHYQILPQTGVIEEWTDYTNTASYDTTLSELRMTRMRIMTDDAANVVFYNMTGDKVDQKHLLKETTNLSAAVSYEGSGGDYYQPFGTFYNQQDGDGVFFTWDYTGSWQATVGTNEGKLLAQSKTPSKNYIECKAGETVTTPVSRTGVYVGDLDDMGNQISDYQYKYRWNYTNDAYMNLIRFGGYGYDSETLMNKINANRYIGGDMLWIDDGWQENLGDWEWSGDLSLSEMREYLEKNGQMLGLWLVPWGASLDSELISEHPDWSLAYTLGSSSTDKKYGLSVENPEVAAYIKDMLNQKQEEFGTFMLKTDYNQYKTDYARASAVMDIISSFKISNPDAGLHLCSDGGGLLNPGTVAYSELLLLQDGTPGLDDGYWVSMLYPIDKILTVNGRGNIGAYSDTNHALLSSAMTVATGVDKANVTNSQMEPVREDCDLYRYLREQGVMGRYVKVYRPENNTGNTYYFLQKMNQDSDKGYITVRFDSAYAGSNVTLYPKGLIAEMNYTVSALEGGMSTETKTGAEWMAQGITLDPIKPGETIFLNLENRPGSGTDDIAPDAPSAVKAENADYMGVSGMQLTWSEGSDNNWISYYEIEKNGAAYDKVSSGTFYFDTEWKEGDTYQVRTVDGDGNVSAYVQPDKDEGSAGDEPGTEEGSGNTKPDGQEPGTEEGSGNTKPDGPGTGEQDPEADVFNKTAPPKTGDSSLYWIWGGICAATLFFAVVMIRRRKFETKK